ncbi:MAG: aminotransferase class V-fold PLP-dependent enzyme [Myxococcales bacterium]|nr:aminotransferase class V-fold PLP-dependent enzyme [Myxococcales bacterium]
MSKTPEFVAQLGSRALFPDLEVDVYLNHAAISPVSRPVRQAVLGPLDGYGRLGVANYGEESARRDRVRAALARLMGAEAEDVALIANTSSGVTQVALCVPWQRGDRVLLFRGEFPANVTPWQQAAAHFGLELVWMEADAFRTDRQTALAELERVLASGIRLVAVSMVQFSTGQRMPMAELGGLCKRYGSELFVDAIQALGIIPLDVQELGIHYLSSGGHKWLMATEGAGVLYVHPDSAAAFRPLVAGWLSHEEPFEFLFKSPDFLRYDRPIVRRAGMVEGGSANVLGTAALEGSLALLEQLGVAQILEHVQGWHDAIEPALISRGFDSARMDDVAGRSGSLCMRPPNSDAGTWASALAEAGVSCASPDGWLRMAPHWPNSVAEVPRVLAAVDAILASGGPAPQA